MTPINFWDYEFAGHTDIANAEIKSLFGDKVFDTPKPTLLLRRMIQLVTEPKTGDIVMDFFAGSASTAHAVVLQNIADDGDRSFIMVQMPEAVQPGTPAIKAGFSTIAQIGKQRLHRAITKILQEQEQQLDIHDETHSSNLGGRVYKLDRSNYKAWQDYQGASVEELETLFDSIETPLVDGWKLENVLTEVMLLQGFPLDSTVTPVPGFTENQIQRIESGAVGHRLFVCLDLEIADATIEQIEFDTEDVFVCLDSALTDEAKLRLADRCTLKVI